MFPNILLPTDFSEYAEKTVRSVCHLQDVRHVTLLHILKEHTASPVSWIAPQNHLNQEEHARKKLENDRKTLEERGIEVTTRIETSNSSSTATAILAVAEEEKPDLIVIGARGKGILTGYLLGSVSSMVLTQSTLHVLITQYRSIVQESPEEKEITCTPAFFRVLCPIDFSRPSLETLKFLEGRSDIHELLLIHVITSAETQGELKARIDHAMEEMKAIRSSIRSDLKTRLFVRFGNPAREISDLAEEEDASLIVMPRCGRKDYLRNVPIGSVTAEVAKTTLKPLLVLNPRFVLSVEARELTTEEFRLAEEIWVHYHQQEADPATDRIFGLFVEDRLVAVARCRRHPDGLEVDGVFTPEEFRGRGYARAAVEVLVGACGSEPLYMHSTISLIPFYQTFGFYPIEEDKLPPTIKARFNFALGDMEGSNVHPMKRDPGQ